MSIKAIQTATADGTPIATPAPTAAPDPSASPAASVAPVEPGGPVVGPITVDVGADGTFDTPLDLSAGKWQIVVTATSAEGKAITLTRNVAIVYKGVNLVVSIKGSTAWLKVWVDGKVSKVTGAAGQVYNPGKVLTFTAQGLDRGPDRQVERDVLHAQRRRTSGGCRNKGNPETWLFAPPDPPVRTDRT